MKARFFLPFCLAGLAHGQVYTWDRDANGNCTAAVSPLPGHGALYQFNTRGQCISHTETNGPDSSFRESFSYDPATGFPTSAVTDPASGGTGLGLNICRNIIKKHRGEIGFNSEEDIRTEFHFNLPANNYSLPITFRAT